MSKPFVYLASLSPRRETLLAQIGVGYQVFVQVAEGGTEESVDETPFEGELPVDYVIRIAKAKAEAGWRGLLEQGLPVYPLLAADTTVAVDHRIFGKPASSQDAADMLRALSGRTHRVCTAVALIRPEALETAVSQTDVTMRALGDDEIGRYVETLEPTGKAGAYAIQGRAAAFVERIDGSYSGVMGLPLFETANLLAAAGLTIV